MKRKGIIGGTGVYDLGYHDGATDGEMRKDVVDTPYGSVEVEILSLKDKKGEDLEIVFLPRHGKDHSAMPHMINYRANVMAMAMMGVDEIYATCMVGSMRSQFGVGEIVTIKDFLDFTKTRPSTFFEEDEEVKHVDVSHPYCQRLRTAFYQSADANHLRVKGGAVYVCTEGPRFESVAEIRFFQMIGGDVVGMTNVPECILAKELGICYGAVGIVSNWAAGIGTSVQFKALGEKLEESRRKVIQVFVDVFRSETDEEKDCDCADSVMVL